MNALLPSVIDPPHNREDLPDADFSRRAEPPALARVLALLLSDGAAALTRALIPVAGRV